MGDDLVERLRDRADKHLAATPVSLLREAADRIEVLEAALEEMTRRRDEWRKKAEGYDAVRLALREKVGAPWPPNISRLPWAGIAADEKKRGDDAEAALAKADELAGLLHAATTSRVQDDLEWQIDALDPEGMIDFCSQAALRGLVLRMGDIARTAHCQARDARK